MHELYELKDKLCKELEEYGKKDMSAGTLDVVDKLAHTVKNLDKIIEMYDGEDGSYAYGTHRIMDGGVYRGSYAGRRYAKRDNMGRYSSMGYSRSDGMVDDLRELMQDAPNEQVRKEFQRLIDKVEQMG